MSSLSEIGGRGWLDQLKGYDTKPFVVSVAYFIGAEAAFLIGTLSDKIFAPFWPPNVVLLCALLLVPERRWWIYIAAVFPAHVIAELQVAMPLLPMLVAFVTNCLVASISALAIRRWLGGPPWFGTLHSAAVYIAIAAVASPALSALGGAFVPLWANDSAQNYWAYWAQWYLSNALGALTLGPVALLLLTEHLNPQSTVPTRRLAEALLLSVLLIVVCTLVFEISARRIPSSLLPALLYLPLPLVLWAAMRFGVKGASSAVLLVTIVSIWRALNEHNVFASTDAEASVLGLQIFLICLAVPTLLLGASIDEVHRAEAATRASEERMAFAAASANACLWHFDGRSDRVWVTDHGYRMLGLSRNVPITRNSLLDVVHTDDRQIVLDAMRAAASSGELDDTEFRIVLPDGRSRWIRARASAGGENGDTSPEISGVLVDVTERKSTESELAQKRHELTHLTRVSMLGALAGGIAHELTQPLTAILSNAQAARLLVAEPKPDLKEVTEALDDIISEDNRAGEVIHRMRGLLKRGEAKFEPVDLNELVHSTLHLVRSELISRRIRFATDLAGVLPSVSADRVQLQQVLLNLAMNAIDAVNDVTPLRRLIVIRTQPTHNGDVEISVSDRGTGLSQSDHERVFQPFFTTKERGLGLGLSICSSIIKLHGGELRIESNSGEGVTATCRIPGQPVSAAVT